MHCGRMATGTSLTQEIDDAISVGWSQAVEIITEFEVAVLPPSVLVNVGSIVVHQPPLARFFGVPPVTAVAVKTVYVSERDLVGASEGRMPWTML